MAFISLTTRNVGDPVYANDYQKIKDDLDDLDSRSSALEASNAKVSMYEGTMYNCGAAFSTLTGYDPKRVSQAFTVTTGIITIYTVGSLTGSLTIDIKKLPGSLDPSGAVSIFTTKPSVNFSTASNYDESTNAVLDITNKSFAAGDYFYFDITGTPSGGIVSKIVLSIYGEV